MRILPADINDRAVAASPGTVVGGVGAPPARHAGVPLGERHLISADSQRLVDADPSLRSLARLVPWGIWRRAHQEFARRYDDHLRAVRAVAEHLEIWGRCRQPGLRSAH